MKQSLASNHVNPEAEESVVFGAVAGEGTAN
jgi:hypothetical protein